MNTWQLLTLQIVHGTMTVENARAILIARARAQRERKAKKIGGDRKSKEYRAFVEWTKKGAIE